MARLQTPIRFSLRMTYTFQASFNPSDSEDVPLPFEIFTDEELEELEQQREQDDWIRSIPNPADRNPRLS